MVTTAQEFFAAAEALPLLPLDRILAPGGVVILAPHPDDESLGCGGLIAQAVAAGRKVAVVFVSDGGMSHPASRRYPRPALRALREREALDALAALGVPPSAATFLALPDAAVPHHGEEFEAAVSLIVETTRTFGARTLLASWEKDPHCDHAATHTMAVAALRQMPGLRHLAYPVWGHTLRADMVIPTGAPRGARLAIASELEAKRRAIHAHRSQTTRLIDDDPQGFILDDAMLAHFDRPFEIFLEPSA